MLTIQCMVDVWVFTACRVESSGHGQARWGWLVGASSGVERRRRGIAWWRERSREMNGSELRVGTWSTAVTERASGEGSAGDGWTGAKEKASTLCACGACGRARTTAAAWRRRRAHSGSRWRSSGARAPPQPPRRAPPHYTPYTHRIKLPSASASASASALRRHPHRHRLISPTLLYTWTQSHLSCNVCF